MAEVSVEERFHIRPFSPFHISSEDTNPRPAKRSKPEKVRVTLWLPKAHVITAKLFHLNISEFCSQSLSNFYNKIEVNPIELVEGIFNEAEDMRQFWREKARLRATEFWSGVMARRRARAKAKYEHIGKIIEEKEGGYSDSGEWGDEEDGEPDEEYDEEGSFG
jgi:hypothetical protein